MERKVYEQNLAIVKEKRRIRFLAVFCMSVFLFVLLLGINLIAGSASISMSDILKMLFLKKGEETTYHIIWQIRLPRLFMAAILGGALSLAGYLLQTFFANPIAGPYILGISSGAKMVVSLVMIVFLKYVGDVSSWILVMAAFAGSMLSIGFVLLLSRRVKNMSVLLVGGIMISYICSAVTDFLITFAEDADIVNLHGWSLGSFSGMTWEQFRFAAGIVLVCFLGTFLLSKPIGAFQMGEAYAQSMGVDIKRFRVLLILLSSILSACVTAFAGPISFVGIAVPHLVKRGLQTANPRIVIPATFLGGANFCLFCDWIARTAFSPIELNISTVTAIFGAPIVIGMLLQRNKGGF